MDNIDLTKLDLSIKIILPSGATTNINPIAQLSVDENNIRKEVILIPAQYALFSSLYVQYKKNRDVLDSKLSQLKVEYAKKARLEQEDINNKRVDEIVESCPDVIELNSRLIYANYYVNQLYHLLQGLELKQKTLSSIDYMNAREERSAQDLSKFKILGGNAINDTGIDINKYEKTKQTGGTNEL